MHRTIILFIFLLSITHTLSSQLCFECLTDYTVPGPYDRYWEDPDGLVYHVDQINLPDKIGLWSYFKLLDNNVREVLSTRYVECLELLDGRSNDDHGDQVKIYPNPTFSNLNLKHPFETCLITISDMNVGIINRKSIQTKECSFDLSNFISGIYILNIKNENTSINKMFIIN